MVGRAGDTARTAFCVQLFFNITLAIIRVKKFRFSNVRGPRPTANIAKIKLQRKLVDLWYLRLKMVVVL